MCRPLLRAQSPTAAGFAAHSLETQDQCVLVLMAQHTRDEIFKLGIEDTHCDAKRYAHIQSPVHFIANSPAELNIHLRASIPRLSNWTGGLWYNQGQLRGMANRGW